MFTRNVTHARLSSLYFIPLALWMSLLLCTVQLISEKQQCRWNDRVTGKCESNVHTDAALCVRERDTWPMSQATDALDTLIALVSAAMTERRIKKCTALSLLSIVFTFTDSDHPVNTVISWKAPIKRQLSQCELQKKRVNLHLICNLVDCWMWTACIKVKITIELEIFCLSLSYPSVSSESPA